MSKELVLASLTDKELFEKLEFGLTHIHDYTIILEYLEEIRIRYNRLKRVEVSYNKLLMKV